jgi:hypothetical protein
MIDGRWCDVKVPNSKVRNYFSSDTIYTILLVKESSEDDCGSSPRFMHCLIRFFVLSFVRNEG